MTVISAAPVAAKPFVYLAIDPLVPPLNDTPRLIEAIGDATSNSLEQVRRQLVHEEQHIGSTVALEAQRLGVRPNEWSDSMFRLYAESDAYMYDSAVWNRTRFKLGMRTWIAKYLAHFATRPNRLDDCRSQARTVLVHGDGMGFDSLHLALCGHQVTYFEVSPTAMRFARNIFDHAGVDVNVVTDASQLRQASFDAVISLDVLEHVPSPQELLEELVGYLRPEGRFVVSAPFYAVCPRRFPTHLRANLNFAGDWKLFEQFGLQLVDGTASWAPLVFRKTDCSNHPPESRPLRRWKVRVGGRVFSMARIAPWAFIPVVKQLLRPTKHHIRELEALGDSTDSNM